MKIGAIIIALAVVLAGCLGGEVKEPANITNATFWANLSSGENVKGSPDAPITIVEFSDFECPFCLRFFKETMPKIEGDYVATGKARIVFRNFPLPSHGQAEGAAEAAECAGRQGGFWLMHDRLFQNQDSLSQDNYRKWAGELGLNAASFNECLDSGAAKASVEDNIRMGADAGIIAVPSFFINGRPVTGAQPYSTFEKIMDEELAKANRTGF